MRHIRMLLAFMTLLVLPASAMQFSDDWIKGPLLPVVRDGKWGYIDRTGKIVVDFQYYKATGFSEGLAGVAVGKWRREKWGFIDTTGKVVIEPQFSSADAFSEGLAPVEIGKKVGYIDKTGKIAIKPQFIHAYHFKNGLAVVELEVNGKSQVVIINRQGNHIYEAGIEPYETLNDGLVAIILTRNSSDELMAIRVGNKYGFIDKHGKTVIPPRFDNVESFQEGVAAVAVNGKWGLINRVGKFVVKPVYHDLDYLSEGMASVTKGEEWGFRRALVDKTGKLITSPKFSNIWRFQNGIAGASTGSIYADNWGFINKKGKFVIKSNYNRIDEFSEGLAGVTLIDNKGDSATGFIDKTGKMVIKPQFSDVKQFHEGLAAVCISNPSYITIDPETGEENIDFGKYGFIDKTGKMVIPAKFGNVSDFVNGIAIVWTSSQMLGGKFSYIDKAGNYIWKADEQ
ncbi:MAG: WG repeat-containing protein [Armatimonadota bacterium]|nr:WG repeat-containing protein [bacterium]